MSFGPFLHPESRFWGHQRLWGQGHLALGGHPALGGTSGSRGTSGSEGGARLGTPIATVQEGLMKAFIIRAQYGFNKGFIKLNKA